MNRPYVKHFVNGVCINPIPNGGVVVSKFPNRKLRRSKMGRPFSNKAGVQLVVTRIGSLSFAKVKKTVQVIPAGWSKAYFDEKEMKTKNANIYRRRKGIAQTTIIN